MSFSVWDARERPLLARSGPPTRLRHTLHQPRIQLLPFLLSGASRVWRGPLCVRRARSVPSREPHDTAPCRTLARDTTPRRLVPHKTSHHKRVARLCTQMLPSLVFVCTLDRTRARGCLVISFFVMQFYGAGRFETSSSVVATSSVTPGRVSVFELAQCFGEDSAARCLSVICFLILTTKMTLSRHAPVRYISRRACALSFQSVPWRRPPRRFRNHTYPSTKLSTIVVVHSPVKSVTL